ncbi:MAG: hypothetical protein PHR38_08915 [Bacteroidales bacterium]|nr:hypothetical protein [Bacteroidales bacterium]MDD3908104.1 hypothetical protein [Bacteroidales bacterium]MDD4712311.1 hypothetical protein [Bacteroidales bacterium]
MKQNKMPFIEPGDRTVFKMPENYFKDFESNLEKHLDALEKEKVSSNGLLQVQTKAKKFKFSMETHRPILYMAAMFVLLLFSISLVLNLSSDKTFSSLRLSAESKTPSATTSVPTAEDYLINSIGTYGITEYYVESEYLK